MGEQQHRTGGGRHGGEGARADVRDPETVVRSYFDSFSSRDPDVIAAHVSDDFTNEHTAALGRGCQGREAYRGRLPGFLADMVDLRYEIETLVAGSADVMVSYRMTARWRGDAPIDIRGAQHLVVSDGLVSRRVDYWDSAAFLVQADPAAAAALAAFGIGGA